MNLGDPYGFPERGYCLTIRKGKDDGMDAGESDWLIVEA
jgi:hypothetical protein